MTTELKKCPFCGGEAKLYMKEDVCFLCCSECDCQARQCETEEEAIKAWNTRKPIDEVVEQLEVLHEMVRPDQMLAVSQAIEIVKKGGAE